ncbi:MAG: tetratricopeptide repeat protein, partial [Gemmatimonadetes bacterium]|nr:tetratricopeptide repeat protein [Gemmatimonadota bacterium]
IEGDPPDRLRPGLGTIYALRALYRVLVDTGVPDPGKTVFLLAGIAGALLLAWGLARLVRATGAPWIAPLALTTAAVQLFFGYIENYTLATALLALWTVETLLEVRAGKRPALSWLWLVFGAGAHAAVLLMLPLQILRYFPARHGVRLALLMAPLFFLATPTAIELGMRRYFVSWTMTTRTGMELGFLSMPHFRFVVNQFIWFVPAALLLGAWTLGRVRSGAKDPDRERETERWAFAIALLWVAFCITVRPWLGARDWDLVSWFSIPLAIAIGLRLLRLPKIEHSSLVWSALALGFVFVFPWVAGNAAGGRGEDRVARIVIHDEHHFIFGKKAHLPKLAWLYFEMGREDLGRMLYEESVRRVPDSSIGRGNWGILCWLDGNYAEAEENLAFAAQDLDDSPPIFYYLGASKFHLQKEDLGESDFRRFLALDPGNPSGASYLGRVCLVTGRWNEAIDQLLVAYGQFPADPDLNYWIARAQYGAKNYGQAREFAERALRLRPGFEEAERIVRATQ